MNRMLKVIRDYPWRDVWALFRENPVRSAAITTFYVLSLIRGVVVYADGYLEKGVYIICGVIFFAWGAKEIAEYEKREYERTQELIRRAERDNDRDRDDPRDERTGGAR